MAVSIGDFYMGLTVDNSGFGVGMIESAGFVELFGDSVSTFMVNPLLGSLNVLKDVAGAAKNFADTILDAATAQVRLADRTGYSLDFIQATTREFERLGLGIDETKDIIIDFSERLGEAQNFGTGTLNDFLEANGIDPRSLGEGEHALQRLVDVIVEMDQAGQTFSSRNVIQSEYGDIFLNAVRAAGGIDQLIDGHRRLAGIQSEEAIRATARLNEEMNMLIRVGKNLATTFGTELLGSFAGDVELTEDSIATIVQQFVSDLIPAAQSIGSDMRDVLDTVVQITQELNKWLDIYQQIKDFNLPGTGGTLQQVPYSSASDIPDGMVEINDFGFLGYSTRDPSGGIQFNRGQGSPVRFVGYQD